MNALVSADRPRTRLLRPQLPVRLVPACLPCRARHRQADPLGAFGLDLPGPLAERIHPLTPDSRPAVSLEGARPIGYDWMREERET